MKYVYILGLEHSGSTLTNVLLCQQSNILGLGEVAAFFSPAHMKNYIKEWGMYEDYCLCSCGVKWEKCEFWKNFVNLNGINSSLNIITKYRILIEKTKKIFPQKEVIVDSSKSFSVLKKILVNKETIRINNNDIYVVLVIKDARSFLASIERKYSRKTTMLKNIRTLNWWVKENSKYLDFMVFNNISYSIVLYENLCEKPNRVINKVLKNINLKNIKKVSLENQNSHIAMGNKDFILYNKSEIKYDKAWFLNDRINMAYMLHKKARAFNKHIYEIV